jgi:hypothetical protein
MRTILTTSLFLLLSSSALAQDYGWGDPPQETQPASTETSASDDDVSHANRADKGGVFGLGVEATLGGTLGLNLRYFFSDTFGLGFTLRFGVVTGSADVAGVDVSFGGFHTGLGVHGLLRLASWSDGAIGIIFGADFGHSNASIDDPAPADGTITSFGISGGLHGEWFATNEVSFHGQVGAGFSFASIGSDGGNLLGQPSTEVGFNIGGDLLAAFGMTVWFE